LNISFTKKELGEKQPGREQNSIIETDMQHQQASVTAAFPESYHLRKLSGMLQIEEWLDSGRAASHPTPQDEQRICQPMRCTTGGAHPCTKKIERLHE